MKFIILLVIWSMNAGHPVMDIIDSTTTMAECKAEVAAAQRKYPDVAKNLGCVPIVTEGWNDPI